MKSQFLFLPVAAFSLFLLTCQPPDSLATGPYVPAINVWKINLLGEYDNYATELVASERKFNEEFTTENAKNPRNPVKHFEYASKASATGEGDRRSVPAKKGIEAILKDIKTRIQNHLALLETDEIAALDEQHNMGELPSQGDSGVGTSGADKDRHVNIAEKLEELLPLTIRLAPLLMDHQELMDMETDLNGYKKRSSSKRGSKDAGVQHLYETLYKLRTDTDNFARGIGMALLCRQSGIKDLSNPFRELYVNIPKQLAQNWAIIDPKIEAFMLLTKELPKENKIGKIFSELRKAFKITYETTEKRNRSITIGVSIKGSDRNEKQKIVLMDKDQQAFTAMLANFFSPSKGKFILTNYERKKVIEGTAKNYENGEYVNHYAYEMGVIATNMNTDLMKRIGAKAIKDTRISINESDQNDKWALGMALNRVCFEMLEQFKALMLASTSNPEIISQSAAFIKLLSGKLHDYLATPGAMEVMKTLAKIPSQTGGNARVEKVTGTDLVKKVMEMAIEKGSETVVLSSEFLKPKDSQPTNPAGANESQKVLKSSISIAICLMVFARRFEQIYKIENADLVAMQLEFEKYMETTYTIGSSSSELLYAKYLSNEKMKDVKAKSGEIKEPKQKEVEVVDPLANNPEAQHALAILQNCPHIYGNMWLSKLKDQPTLKLEVEVEDQVNAKEKPPPEGVDRIRKTPSER